MPKFLKFIITMIKISRLEKAQARPLREIMTATMNGGEVPAISQKKLLELDARIKALRNDLH